MKKKTINKSLKTLYFDGGALLSLAGQGTNLIPKDTTLGGATNGAMQGASLGNSLIPGYGAIAGGLIGGIAGGFQGSNAADQKQLTDFSNSIDQRNQMLGFAEGGNLLTEFNGGFTHNDPNNNNINSENNHSATSTRTTQ